MNNLAPRPPVRPRIGHLKPPTPTVRPPKPATSTSDSAVLWLFTMGTIPPFKPAS